MSRRSVYLRSDVAARLNTAVDDLHYATRQPKHVVLAAIADVALNHRDEVEARLKGRPSEDEKDGADQ